MSKAELDRLELVERVPELQRRAVRDLPRHPAVVAYVKECATMARPVADLRTARRNFDTARVTYENRCAFRRQTGIKWRDGGRSVSLSSIIEARAAAKHWNKVMVKLETAEKLDHQQRWNAARSRVYSGRAPL